MIMKKIISILIALSIITSMFSAVPVEARNVITKYMVVGEKLVIKKAKWSNSNKRIAIVKGKQTIIAKKGGKITLKAKIGKKKQQINVVVLAPNKETVILDIGETFQIKTSGVSYKKFKWTTADKKIISVSKTGKVKALSSGRAYISGTYKNKSISVCFFVNKDDEDDDLNVDEQPLIFPDKETTEQPKDTILPFTFPIYDNTNKKNPYEPITAENWNYWVSWELDYNPNGEFSKWVAEESAKDRNFSYWFKDGKIVKYVPNWLSTEEVTTEDILTSNETTDEELIDSNIPLPYEVVPECNVDINGYTFKVNGIKDSVYQYNPKTNENTIVFKAKLPDIPRDEAFYDLRDKFVNGLKVIFDDGEGFEYYINTNDSELWSTNKRQNWDNDPFYVRNTMIPSFEMARPSLVPSKTKQDFGYDIFMSSSSIMIYININKNPANTPVPIKLTFDNKDIFSFTFVNDEDIDFLGLSAFEASSYLTPESKVCIKENIANDYNDAMTQFQILNKLSDEEMKEVSSLRKLKAFSVYIMGKYIYDEMPCNTYAMFMRSVCYDFLDLRAVSLAGIFCFPTHVTLFIYDPVTNYTRLFDGQGLRRIGDEYEENLKYILSSQYGDKLYPEDYRELRINEYYYMDPESFRAFAAKQDKETREYLESFPILRSIDYFDQRIKERYERNCEMIEYYEGEVERYTRKYNNITDDTSQETKEEIINKLENYKKWLAEEREGIDLSMRDLMNYYFDYTGICVKDYIEYINKQTDENFKKYLKNNLECVNDSHMFIRKR